MGTENSKPRRTVYLLSDSFPYDKMVARDAGPRYGHAYGWETVKMGDYVPLPEDLVVIDNRLEESDFKAVSQLISSHPGPVGLKIVDSYTESRDQIYHQFLLNLAPRRGLVFISPYQAEEVARELLIRHGERNFIVLPYAYEAEREIQTSWAARRKRVLVSGNMAPKGYPYRWAFHMATYHRPWAFFKTKYLPHCGYPDVGQTVRHSRIADSYVDYLATFRFALVCPGRLGFEFLRYAECAYAGCLPVGKGPRNWEDGSGPALFEIAIEDIKGGVKSLFSTSDGDLGRMALEYREWFRKNRNPAVLNDVLHRAVSAAMRDD